MDVVPTNATNINRCVSSSVEGYAGPSDIGTCAFIGPTYVAVCCSVLQCVAVCCSVLQFVAVCCTVLQCAVVCCSVLQCVAVLQCFRNEYQQMCVSSVEGYAGPSDKGHFMGSMCVAVCCSVLQCVAVCCSVLQRVAACCSVLQCVAFSQRISTHVSRVVPRAM